VSGLTKEAVVEVLADHTIECTGLGEVTCRACRDLSWMSWSQYRGHLANLIVALVPKGYLKFCSVTKYCRMSDGHDGSCKP
jgi:hypothetical protein